MMLHSFGQNVSVWHAAEALHGCLLASTIRGVFIASRAHIDTDLGFVQLQKFVFDDLCFKQDISY